MMQELLRSKFGDCNFANKVNCTGSYENISDDIFYVFHPPPEHNLPVRVLTVKDDECQLNVTNPEKKNICLVKTDKCLFTNDVSKCDCLLFDASRLFLVEIKNTSSGGRKAARNKAIAQLGSTLDLLRDNNVDLADFDTTAILCFKTKNSRPIQAATTAKQAEFFEQYHVVLKEINELTF